MRKLWIVVVMIGFILGISSSAFAQVGNVSADMWFANHVLDTESKFDDAALDDETSKSEAPSRLTVIKGEFDITEKIGLAGSAVFGKSNDYQLTEGDNDPEAFKAHSELRDLNVSVQYQIIPGVKARAGLFTGGLKVLGKDMGDEVWEFKVSGLTIGAGADFAAGNGISLYGEGSFAPLAKASFAVDKKTTDMDSASMTRFEAGGKYDFGQFHVKAGYRYQSYNLKMKDKDDDDNEMDVTYTPRFSGLFVGVGASF